MGPALRWIILRPEVDKFGGVLFFESQLLGFDRRGKEFERDIFNYLGTLYTKEKTLIMILIG